MSVLPPRKRNQNLPAPPVPAKRPKVAHRPHRFTKKDGPRAIKKPSRLNYSRKGGAVERRPTAKKKAPKKKQPPVIEPVSKDSDGDSDGDSSCACNLFDFFVYPRGGECKSRAFSPRMSGYGSREFFSEYPSFRRSWF